jgi:hypothetical protein
MLEQIHAAIHEVQQTLVDKHVLVFNDADHALVYGKRNRHLLHSFVRLLEPYFSFPVLHE